MRIRCARGFESTGSRLRGFTGMLGGRDREGGSNEANGNPDFIPRRAVDERGPPRTDRKLGIRVWGVVETQFRRAQI